MNVGILGCGLIADFHLPHILKQPEVGSVSVADLNRDRAEATAKKYGLENVYPDLSSMLGDQKIDVIHVLTPPATHARLAIQAVEAGCHVFVEKPMALSAAEAEAMVAAAQRNSVKLAVDHNFLLSPIMRQIGSMVKNGQLGRLTHVEANYSFDIRRSPHLNTACARAMMRRVHWSWRPAAGVR